MAGEQYGILKEALVTYSRETSVKNKPVRTAGAELRVPPNTSQMLYR
jgi:hypothetical protein